MRVFLAGATGVLGVRLVPLLVGEGHEVAGMTRSPDKVEALRDLGAEPVVCDVYDADRMRREGTRNLIAAARAAGAPRFVAQSIAWLPRGGEDSVAEHEQQVLDAGGVVEEAG